MSAEQQKKESSSGEFGLVVIGAGPAGVFGALRFAELCPEEKVLILEAGEQALRKVRISGGGRCNVTQHCFEVSNLLKAYPRGHRELWGPFSRFQPRDTMQWFESRGVRLKVEADGRVFPLSDSSQSIVDCLLAELKRQNIELRLKTKVLALRYLGEGQGFSLTLKTKQGSQELCSPRVLLASGGVGAAHELAKALGHKIETTVPSLFTFESKEEVLAGLSGLAVPRADLQLEVAGKNFRESGPVLITHWGLSGPAVIRLSAWAARELAEARYQAILSLKWNAELSTADLQVAFVEKKKLSPKASVLQNPLVALPLRLWKSLCQQSSISPELSYADLAKTQLRQLEQQLLDCPLKISGKGVFKEEFVTCGGISLKEVDLRRMQSKLLPGLFFAGEVLDVDGITGGYNFQFAWTSGWLSAESAAG